MPLRPALLSPCFWPEVRRGGERFTRDLADGLITRGHHPRLITSHPGPLRRGVEEGLPILRLPRPPHGPFLRRRYEPYVTHVPLAYAALRLGDDDLAHAVYPTDALAAARWRTRTHRPAILSYLGIPTGHWLDERHRRQVLAAAVRGCDAVIALSQHAAAEFARELGFQARVIRPGVDLTAFAPRGARSEQPTLICSAAVEEPRKGVAVLVDALGLVRRERPGTRLVLSAPRSLERARRAGVRVDEPGVEWRGLDDRATLARAYSEAWVSVLPSSDEAFGLVLAEALACGTPVVGRNHGAIPEVIDRSGIGLLCERLDPPELARTLLAAMELSERPETARRCRERAEELSIDRCVEAYLSLYRELGAGTR